MEQTIVQTVGLNYMDSKHIISINDLNIWDPSFNEESFIAKVDNIFIMLCSSIMEGNLERVRHRISDEVYNKYNQYVSLLNTNNERQIYGEMNVKSTKFLNAYLEDDKYIINVLLISRYMDYIIDKSSLELKRGFNTHRIEKNNYLRFSKKRITNKESIGRKCPGCGANIDANYSGKCEYCGTIYDAVNYDWILDSIESS